MRERLPGSIEVVVHVGAFLCKIVQVSVGQVYTECSIACTASRLFFGVVFMRFAA